MYKRQLLDGDASVADHLRRQRVAVQARMGELAELVAAIDRALESHMSDSPMTDAQMRELFGDSFSEDDQAEAEQRWGATDAWAQSCLLYTSPSPRDRTRSRMTPSA